MMNDDYNDDDQTKDVEITPRLKQIELMCEETARRLQQSYKCDTVLILLTSNDEQTQDTQIYSCRVGNSLAACKMAEYYHKGILSF